MQLSGLDVHYMMMMKKIPCRSRFGHVTVPAKGNQENSMATSDQVLPPPTEETIQLIELHRQLIALHNLQAAREDDAYSLAQPSPFRFVPSIASNGAGTIAEGE
jgi:hypothetical protein